MDDAGWPTPERVQLKRKKGWRMPERTRCVDRSTIFGNPFKVTDNLPAGAAVASFRAWLKAEKTEFMPARRSALLNRLWELKGCNLACWCRLEDPCHADVLLEIANSPEVS